MTKNLSVCSRSLAFGDGVGGMERAAALHITAMLSEGFKLRLYTPLSKMRGVAPPGVELIDVPWPKWDFSRTLSTSGAAYLVWTRRLAKALEARSPEEQIVHFHGGSAGALLRRKLRQRVFASVANPHGMEEFGTFSLPRTLNRLFQRPLVRGARFADYVVSTDDSLVEAVLRNIRVGREKVVVIPNAVDTSLLDRQANKAHRRSNFTIVSIGRLVHNKGYDLLLDALKIDEVAQCLPDFQWIHFGSGPDLEHLKQRAGEAPSINLDVRGRRPDSEVQSTLASADLFVQPSRYEGSSLTTLEAMAHGRIVVATPVGGIPDKVRDGYNGILADSPTSLALASALIRAVHMPAEMGARARATVMERFSSGAAQKLYAKIYFEASLAAEGRRSLE